VIEPLYVAAHEVLLDALDALGISAALQTFDDTVSERERLLNDAESAIHTLSAASVRGQLRDFNEIIDVNRAAVSVLTMTRGPILRRAWGPSDRLGVAALRRRIDASGALPA
jgi:hypothetical protein